MFKIRDLSVLAYANGFTLWHYKTGNDTLETVKAPNFFNDASEMMATGDLVMITGSNGASVVAIVSHENNVTVAALS